MTVGFLTLLIFGVLLLDFATANINKNYTYEVPFPDIFNVENKNGTLNFDDILYLDGNDSDHTLRDLIDKKEVRSGVKWSDLDAYFKSSDPITLTNESGIFTGWNKSVQHGLTKFHGTHSVNVPFLRENSTNAPIQSNFFGQAHKSYKSTGRKGTKVGPVISSTTGSNPQHAGSRCDVLVGNICWKKGPHEMVRKLMVYSIYM